MKTVLAVVLAAVSIQCAAQSQSSSRREAINELMAVVTSNQAVWSMIVNPFVAAGMGANPSADPRVWADLEREIKGVVMKAASAPGGPIHRTITRYEEKFTEAEVRKLLEFFGSDVGRKFLSEQAALEFENNIQMEAFVKQILPELQRALTAFFKERGLRLPR